MPNAPEQSAPGERVTSASEPNRIASDLAARLTGMSFQRTRMSADRTLMSVIRTSLALIGFGFTIFQAFHQLYERRVIESSLAPRRFGLTLALLGIAMLISGIGFHVMFMLELRRIRRQMKEDGLIHAETRFPVSLTLIVAILLLVIGLLAIGSMVYNLGPFG